MKIWAVSTDFDGVLCGIIRVVLKGLVLVSSVVWASTSVSVVSVVTVEDLLVGDLWFVTFVVSGVFYDLPSAVRKKDVVSALSDISLTLFLVAEVVSRSSIFYFVFELVVGGFLWKSKKWEIFFYDLRILTVASS